MPSHTDDVRLIPLVHGGEAIIDASDFDAVSGYKWRRRKYGDLEYAVASATRDGKYTSVCLHRLILGLAHDERRHVDHVNHDGLDNRRCNIRVATPKQNAANSRKRRGTSSRYHGVFLHTDKYWLSRIEFGGRENRESIPLGCYAVEEEAAYAYMVAAGAIRARRFLHVSPIPKHLRPPATRLAEIKADVRTRIERHKAGDKARPTSTSRFRCVYQNRTTLKWHVQVRVAGKIYSLGGFRTESEAAVGVAVACGLLGVADPNESRLSPGEMPAKDRCDLISAVVANVLSARAQGIKGALPGRMLLST